jgi:hypothetical protein
LETTGSQNRKRTNENRRAHTPIILLKKEIRFSPTEKNQIEKILKSLNEIIFLFDGTIKKSINELKT